MAAMTHDQFKKLMGLNQPEPLTNAVATGLNFLKQPLDQYALDKRFPLVGGMTAADFTGITGTQGLVQDFSRGKNITGDMRMFEAMGLVPSIAPAMKLTGKATNALGKEVARQIETGTGVIGRNALDPRMNMIAYHGSPHTFDKFDMSKIGTGEGAQAYGHGLYFAESPNVANGYKSALSNPEIAFPNGKRIANVQSGSPMDMAKSWLEDAFTNQSSAPYQYASKGIKNLMKYEKNQDTSMKALNILKKLEKKGAKVEQGGSLYKVDIPDEAIPKMLNYDAPVKDQPHVLSVIRNMLPADMLKSFDTNVESGITGANAYKNWLWDAGKTEASKAEALKQSGITGIRYLDGSSRGAGQGSSNFVVFDDKLPKILERNGLLMP